MIPVNEPIISKNAQKYVTNCIKTGWISSSGTYLKDFEKEFAKYIGTKFASTTTNGTASLHLALTSLNLKKGDEVIMPAHTIISCAFAAIYNGLKPVLIDVERDTWNIDVSKIESKITKKTKAIMPVHIYGHPVDMDPILKIAKKYNLFIVEDAAEAHGATYKKRRVGSLGDIGCFSFYANKIVTTGEGGMVVTDNEKIWKKIEELKNLSHSPKRRFLHEHLGFNYRMTNLQAALGLAQLEEVNSYVNKKIWMAKLYNKLLNEVEGITLPIEKPWAKNVYWMYGIIIGKEFGITRDEFQKELKNNGIDTRTFFISLHRQPVLKKMGLFNNEKYPITDDISKRGLYLPSGLAITEEQIKAVCKTIKKIKQKKYV